jgi:hypothetical protein
MPDDPMPMRLAIYREPNTKRAAALLPVGANFFSDRDNARTPNTYSEKAPYRPGAPGQVSYLLAEKSTAGIPAETLGAAFDAQDFAPTHQLDELVEEIIRAAPHLGNRLKELLPLAIVSYLRGGFENRERILDLWKKALPMVLIQHTENSFTLVHRNAPDKVLQRWGLKK